MFGLKSTFPLSQVVFVDSMKPVSLRLLLDRTLFQTLDYFSLEVNEVTGRSGRKVFRFEVDM